MTDTSPETARSVAVEQLTAFDLSAYAARTFVGLVSLGGGTAEEVSDVVAVPRTRVYDAVTELEFHGLVDVRQSRPKQFWPVSAETAGRHFERYYRSRAERLTDALSDLEASASDDVGGVWTVTGRAAVEARTVEFIDEAESEIIFMTVEQLLDDDVLDALAEASARGVAVRLGETAVPVEANIRERVPEAELVESIWAWSDTAAGRLLMVDRRRILVSVLVENGDPADRDETALWASGPTNAFVVVLRAMFAAQLDDPVE